MPGSTAAQWVWLSEGYDVDSYAITPDRQNVVFIASLASAGGSGYGMGPWGFYTVPIDGSAAPTLVLNGLVDRNSELSVFTISPDGAAVGYVEVGVLHHLSLTGGPPTALGPATTSVPLAPLFTSDSETIVVWQDTTDGWHAWAVPVDGSARIRITTDPLAIRPRDPGVLAGDGEYLVFDGERTAGVRELISARLDGSGSTALNPTLPTRGDVKDWVLGEDDHTIVYRADQVTNNDNELWATSVAGGPTVRLNRPLPTNGDVKTGYAISPDGATVIYIADERTNNVRELFAIGIEGTGRIRLTKALPKWGDVNEAAISTDGTTVVFRADQRRNNYKELFAVPLTDGPLTRLNPPLPPGGDVKPPWRISPDSQRAVFIGDVDVNGEFGLHTTRLDGSAPQRLSGPPDPRGRGVPRSIRGFTPDGAWVIYDDDGCLWHVRTG